MKSKVKFALTPLEAVPSLPIPEIIKNRTYLSIFFFIGKRLNRKEKMKLYRPIVKFTIDVNSSKVASYINYSVLDEFPESDWKKPIGEFPHDNISKMTLKEYKQSKDELIQDYDKVINELKSKGHDQSIRKEFREKFYHICEPGLIPFMEKAGGDFFQWLS